MSRITIYAALPVMNEPELAVALKSLMQQDYPNFRIYICVNQPEEDWQDENRQHSCAQNQKTLAELSLLNDSKIRIIDKASKGKGWDKKHIGVGWARKTLMDEISSVAEPHDLIVSVDADSFYPANYFSSLAKIFEENPTAVGLANPYYHPLVGAEEIDRNILRYEIYMRHYLYQMKRIGSPYAFTAVGSAMAAPLWAYRKVGGITPVKSGEDFYFLQKLAKVGPLLTENEVMVYPAARLSDRVFFGTGPALIKGLRGDWKSYPIYEEKYFDEIKEILNEFPLLFDQKTTTEVFDKECIQKFRKNAKNKEKFLHYCIEKFDALRMLQFLKQKQNESKRSDDEIFLEFFEKYFPDFPMPENFSFANTAIEILDEIRTILAK